MRMIAGSLRSTITIPALPTCRVCLCTSIRLSSRSFRRGRMPFTHPHTPRLRRRRSQISSATTIPFRAPLTLPGAAASAVHQRVDPVQVPRLPRGFLAQTAAKHLPATICSDDIWQERPELLLNLRSIDKRAATNAQDPKQDVISRSPHAVDAVREESSAPMLPDPATPTFARLATSAPCPKWMHRCSP